MEKQKENLNIEYNWKILVTYALRKYQSVKIASQHLGVTDRTVFRYINEWDIVWKKPKDNGKKKSIPGMDEEN